MSGLSAIRWASQRDPGLLHVPPLNDLSYPPIHPDFMRRAGSLQKEDAQTAYAGATVLALTSAYQTWMHVTNTQVETVDPEHQQHETRTSRQIIAPEAQRAAGGLLYEPGAGWAVTDLSTQHIVHSGTSGSIRLSATVMGETEGVTPSSEPQAPATGRYYFLNMHTYFQESSVPGRPSWAIGEVEAGIIDHERFGSVETPGFHRLVRMAQLLNTLARGEGYLVDTPQYGYNLGQTPDSA